MRRKSAAAFAALLVISALSTVASRSSLNESSSDEMFTIQMIGYSPTQTDDYVAVSRAASPGYIVGFEPLANADRVHHMLLYGCTQPAEASGFWRGQSTCAWNGGSYILYAWARNAPNLKLPKDVAFSVGHENDGIKFFVLQVHYAAPFAGQVHDFSGITLRLSQHRPANLAAVLLFVGGTPIPPRMEQFQSNISCEFEAETSIHPFAFRTHTHAMGRVVSAFYKHANIWTEIGIRNPQWPQLFQSIPTKLAISRGDLMAASCRFDSHDKNVTVHMGAMGVDEMCNFYMMYFYDANQPNPYPNGGMCGGVRKDVMQDYPLKGFSLLPSKPELEHHAHQSKVPFGVIQEARHTSVDGVKLGQVSGLAFDSSGHIYIFHRANRVWDMSTFDNYNVLLDKKPISQDVILVVEYTANSTRVLKKLGRNQFYLPHGIFVDVGGFVYTTDVGSHTVAKWKIDGEQLVKIWESGQNLLPDSDETHFCKPSGVTRIGSRVYVTDGYCNSRIVVLNDSDGRRIKSFGVPGSGPVQFELPHDVVSNSRGNLLITDRENGRVQELTTDGAFIGEYKSSLFSNVYSADVFEDYVFMVPGRATRDADGIAVYVARIGTGLIEYTFGPQQRGPRETLAAQFGQPHVLRVCPNGEHVFVGDIDAGSSSLWQFKIQHEESGAMMSAAMDPTATGRSLSVVLIAVAAMICIVGYITIRRRWKILQNGAKNFDKKGFKPLRTDETVGFISEGSDSE